MEGLIRRIFLFLTTLIVGSSLTFGQAHEVQYSFKIDGADVNERFIITVFLGDQEYTAKSVKGRFWLPPEVSGVDRFAIRFASKTYRLFFDPVFYRDTTSIWRIGIDNPPFEKENVTSGRCYDNVSTMHYLGLTPRGDGMANRIVVEFPWDSR